MGLPPSPKVAPSFYRTYVGVLMKRFILFYAFLPFLLLVSPLISQAETTDDIEVYVEVLKSKSTKQKTEAIQNIAKTGHVRAGLILEAFLGGKLYSLKENGAIVIINDAASDIEISNAIFGEDLGVATKKQIKKLRINNKLRGVVKASLAELQLSHPDKEKRMAAALSKFKSAGSSDIPLLENAIASEENKSIKKILIEAKAAAELSSNDSAIQLAAIKIIEKRGDSQALNLLTQLSQSAENEQVKNEAKQAVGRVESSLALWDISQTLFYGLSLGSVLLLAAIGLAITFGVMGVINMAHGEMIMIGAYTTFIVQEVIRNSMPELFDASLFIALPLAFLITGLIGIGIERGIIRFLYGRPLETLLATWGVSLFLQQAVRSIFGPSNREVGNPSWMSGSFELGQMAITYNRLWIIIFSLGVLFMLMLAMKYTSFGLRMRAVTQNRKMAGSMGIKTGWVDALTFGLGSGIAGIAGVTLSQIDNVSPNLGQSYIIDSFMVVVFGGVGNLWGTLVGAMSLGVFNKFLEPAVGAVLAKILVLVLIILFIQKRPRGLFALKGRAVE